MQKFENIRYFRVLACIGVFAVHFAPRMGVSGLLAKIAGQGSLGVYLFFLISGFLACGAKELASENGVRGVLIYYCKRLFRIVPLYYAVILYNMAVHCLILKDVTPDPQGLKWLRYFFMTNAFFPAPDNFWGNQSGTWTISLFCVFYLCAPLFARLARGVKSAALLYLGALLLRYVWVGSGYSSYMMIFYYMHFFVLGIFVRRLALKYSPAVGTGIFVAFSLALAALLQLTGAGGDYFLYWSWIFAAAVLATSRMGAAADGKVRTDQNTFPGKLKKLGGAAVRTLDSYSYDIYLVHAVVYEGIVLIQGKVYLAPLVVLGLAVGLTAAGCFVTKRLIEIPAGKLCARAVSALRK